jgi:NAD(P)-dependent dehydrogenase (short-subunit alcohol dehydrogenase family)
MRIPRPIGGKVVVITGAGRGIGEALAVRLAVSGARVALLGLEPDRLQQVAERCGPNAAWWECDVTDPEALRVAAAGVQQRFRRVDVLVANAGIAVGSTMRLADPASFDRVIEVNLLGSIRTVRAFLPQLIASRGYYLQIASLAAMAPAPMLAAYCASKAGVEAFSQSLRSELGHHGVDTGVAYLSFTNTDMTRSAHAQLDNGELHQTLPGALGKLYDLDEAVDRLAGGIARRAPYVYGQSFIRWVRPIRWLLPSVIYRGTRAGAARSEAALADRGVDASLPVGPGGRADLEARTQRDAERPTVQDTT